MVRQARLVRVHGERIDSYADALLVNRRMSKLVLPYVVEAGKSSERIAAYVITLDAVNFGSGYFPYLRKRPNHSGYRTIEASLVDRFRERGPLSAWDLRSIDLHAMAAIFNQDPDHPIVRSLMRSFVVAWNDLGAFLIEDFAGSFRSLVESAAGSAEALALRLTEMPLFRDVATYRDRHVAFYKRAQIVPADLSLAFSGEGLGRFGDLARLTSFADNLVPHVLRVDGILEYDPHLQACIDRGELIPPGSGAEVEIRAAAVHAVELIVDAANRQGHHLAAIEIDHILWNRGQARPYKQHPRHRTRTVFY